MRYKSVFNCNQFNYLTGVEMWYKDNKGTCPLCEIWYEDNKSMCPDCEISGLQSDMKALRSPRL